QGSRVTRSGFGRYWLNAKTPRETGAFLSSSQRIYSSPCTFGMSWVGGMVGAGLAAAPVVTAGCCGGCASADFGGAAADCCGGGAGTGARAHAAAGARRDLSS